MFTGIIEETGRVASFTQGGDAWKLQIEGKAALTDIAHGDSIAVNGCCLTVTRFDAGHVWFDVLEETRRVTSFTGLKAGDAVNLERALRFDGKIGGHFVSGHVDSQGVIEVFESRGADHYLRVKAPEGCGRYLIQKGSITIDGISLTVAEVSGDVFAVWIIPTTIQVTNLREKAAGAVVNLEFDLIGKYVEKLAAPYKS